LRLIAETNHQTKRLDPQQNLNFLPLQHGQAKFQTDHLAKSLCVFIPVFSLNMM